MNDIQLWTYDFECLKYDWCVTFKNYETKEYLKITNDPLLLQQFTQTHQEDIYIGFNNTGYDQWIWQSILVGDNSYLISQRLIVEKQKGWTIYRQNKVPKYQFDLKQHLPITQSLKLSEGNLGLEIKESDVEFQIDRPLNETELESLLSYNVKDVDATEFIFENEMIGTFESKLMLIQMFNLPLSDISKTFANLTAKILGAHKKQWTDNNVYERPQNLILNKYQYIADYFGTEVTDDFQSRQTKIANAWHTIGLGGIHGEGEEHYYEGLLIILDVFSYYPSLMIIYLLLSRNVVNPQLFADILKQRQTAKHDQNKPVSEALKIVVNTTYGASGASFNQLYDPRMRKSVCITGQLFLIDLIEKLEPDIQILIQSNTDGIMIKISSDKTLAKIHQAVDEWEQRTRLKLEWTIGKRMWQKDVNNYIFEDNKGHLKYKGAWVKDGDIKNNSATIINESIREYYVNGVLPQDYIKQSHPLIKYQLIGNAGATYKDVYQQIDNDFQRIPQRINRCFATNVQSYGSLYKMKQDKTTYEKIANIPEHCLVINENIQGNTNKDLEPILDYQFYIDATWKRINEFLK